MKAEGSLHCSKEPAPCPYPEPDETTLRPPIVILYNSLYEGRLISNAHSEIFCRRNKVAMRAQCVLVTTTLLHSGAKFHSFLYTGYKTVRVNMESCYGGMSTTLKQRAVTEFLSAENVTPAKISSPFTGGVW